MQRLLTLLLVGIGLSLAAQPKPLTYYLPDISYNPDIPTPEAFLGYQIGEWHISHDQQLMYMRHLAELSPRMQLRQHARTHEGRPLVHIIVTSERNQARIDEIQARHVALSDPASSAGLDLTDMPVVIYQGYSIHGNEPSGANAAPLVAYYLAAAQGREIEAMLDKLVVIFDPSFNPDGLTRFSTWANMHKNKNLTAKSDDREYHEAWPGGRTNHYWFDINRDWLPVQQPESRGRIKTFHDWKPNILTDHHEMGSNSTFFFMPGEQTRVHPLTPKMNQELTARIADYHAEALDKLGSLYYSGEGYDDFYYGKGSTYPDANGCVGILFEQASSRGHLQETDNGLLSFPFTIRNQVTTALSTYRAGVGLREDLLDYQRKFYQDARKEGDQTGGAYVFGDPDDEVRNRHLVDILLQHRIDVYRLGKDVDVDGKSFSAQTGYAVPLAQDQYKMIRAIFETRTSFEDSLFYDISAWTLPMAFNLPYAETGSRGILGEKIDAFSVVSEPSLPAAAGYAYLVDWDDYYAPKAVYKLLNAGLRAKVATRPLALEGITYPAGTVMIPAQNQEQSPEEVYTLIREAARESSVLITPVATGYSPVGPDLGSNDFEPLELPRILLAIGGGVSGNDAGEIWHLFDQRYNIVTTKVETDELSRIDLWDYNVVILPSGSYGSISDEAATIKRWVQDGGTLITFDRAATWAAQNGLANIKTRPATDNSANGDVERRPYAMAARDRGGKVIGGAIFGIEADLTHPVFYGYHRKEIPVFKRGTLFFEPGKNAYGTPALYKEKPLLSGYLNSIYDGKIDGSAAVIVSGIGSGRSIAMNFNPAFRAFWFGTNKILMNSVFFGSTISGGTTE
ncbi:MAG: M14 family zinc carboxypeptidase [Saprospiraceae bacterium]|nr:zinc carboxypeptidase [Lewinella sp.]